ncbi:hypothetical protein [Massilia sp. TN1-12]|uniref:hypothetical protein n=1 Tax=Massilia paldalensis TaxID=3377675 RepID=UPI003850B545
MAKVLYQDRDGKRIDGEQYKQARQDPSYVQVRSYDNNQVRATVEWIGRIENPQDQFPDYYKLFRVDVWNYTDGGQLAKDPAYPQFFSNEAAAAKEYEAFIERWTEAERMADGELVEHGNTLLPPPPPNPDAPASIPLDDDVAGVGAW